MKNTTKIAFTLAAALNLSSAPPVQAAWWDSITSNEAYESNGHILNPTVKSADLSGFSYHNDNHMKPSNIKVLVPGLPYDSVNTSCSTLLLRMMEAKLQLENACGADFTDKIDFVFLYPKMSPVRGAKNNLSAYVDNQYADYIGLEASPADFESFVKHLGMELNKNAEDEIISHSLTAFSMKPDGTLAAEMISKSYQGAYGISIRQASPDDIAGHLYELVTDAHPSLKRNCSIDQVDFNLGR